MAMKGKRVNDTLILVARPPTDIKCIQKRLYKVFHQNSTVFNG